MKKLFFVIAFLVLTFQANATCDIHEKMKAEKIAFITDRMDLSSEEAVAFWPVYNDWWKAMREAHYLTQVSLKKIKEFKGTPGAAEKLMDEYIANCELEAQVMRIYYKKFKEVVPAEKLLKLYAAEEEFRIIMIKRFRNNEFPENHGKKK